LTLGAGWSLGPWGKGSFTSLTARLNNSGAQVLGNVSLPAGRGGARRGGKVSTSGAFSIRLTLGAGWSLGPWGRGSCTSLTARLNNSGVGVTGNVNLPAGLGSASFDGTVSTSGAFSIGLTLGAGWSLGPWGKGSFTSLTARLNNSGAQVLGGVSLPAG